MIRRIPVENSVGRILSHDITEIRPGEFKGTAFHRGHCIREADICHLQRLGKEHIFILEVDPDSLHEDDAAVALAEAFCGPGTGWSGPPREGKLKLVAKRDGLFYVDVERLTEINLLGDIMCSCRHIHSMVRSGEVIAATRAIPLTVKKELVDLAVSLAGDNLFRITKMKQPKAGCVITGNEVFTGLVEDGFEPVLRKKLTELNGVCLGVSLAPDRPEIIRDRIRAFIAAGANLIMTTGGMSVDPDDITRQGIAMAGATGMVYGAPVLPGAMLMIAYIGDIPVLGIPACGLYHQTTVLDLVLPRLLAGERLGRRQLAEMAHGGMCLDCPQCRYPVCPFGK